MLQCYFCKDNFMGLPFPFRPSSAGCWQRRKEQEPHSPVADRIGPRALARAPRLRRIPITRPFWLAEPVQTESGCGGVLLGQGTALVLGALFPWRCFPHTSPPAFLPHSLPNLHLLPLHQDKRGCFMENQQGLSRGLGQGCVVHSVVHSPHHTPKTKRNDLYIVPGLLRRHRCD